MPSLNRPPESDAIIAALNRRLKIVESLVGTLVETRLMPTPFSFAGTPEEDVESPAWRPVHSVKINLIVPQVLTAPSGGDLTIDLTLYGPIAGVVRTLTIPDGANYVEDAVPFIIPQGGSLTAKVTNVAGAIDLSISLVPELI